MKKSKLKDRLLNTKNLFMVDVRFYDAEKGIEKESEELVPKAIVTKVDKYYFNYVTGERLPYISGYGNDSGKHIQFGTIENKELMQEKGICYVKTDSEFIDEIRKQDQVSERELEEKILHSSIYFKDRIYIVESRVNLSEKGIHGIRGRKLLKMANKDWEKNCHFKQKLDAIRDAKKLQK